MHVVIVSDYAEVNGGAARVSIAAARSLAESDVQVTYYCGSGRISDTLRHPLIAVRHLGLTDIWNTPNLRRAAASSLWNVAARKELRGILLHAPPDTVVHFHQWTRCLSPSIFSAVGRIPWAVSLHDYFFVCPNGLLYIAPQQRSCNIQPMSAKCIVCNCDTRSRVHKAARIARQFATGIARSIAQTPANFIHVSELAMNVARPYLPRGATHFVVPNPCDVTWTGRVDVRHNRAFVFVGRLQREKGVIDFAEAARRAGVPAIFLGNGPERGSIQAVYPSAVIRPWGSSDSVENTLREARCLVLPSRWNETFGLTVAEAQAIGVPSIVARNSGASQLVQHSGGGVVVEGGSIDQLANEIRCLAADDERVALLGRMAYDAHSNRLLDERTYGKQLIECYAEILRCQRAYSPLTQPSC